MRDLTRVYGITKNGEIMQAESETLHHNKLATELYKDYLTSLSTTDKKVEGCGVDIYWPAITAVVKNRKDLIILEVYIKEDEDNFSLVFTPNRTTQVQLEKFKQRYSKIDKMVFYDETNVEGEKFESKKEYMPFSNMYNYLKQRNTKIELDAR